MRVVVYPGTFDPVTNGHLDIIKRASNIFDQVVVGISSSKDKNSMFSFDMREKMMNEATKDLDKVIVESFDTLTVEFAKKHNATAIIRGLRAISDFEYELQIGYANESLDRTIETIYLMPSLKYAFISSSIVRSIFKYRGNISHLVPPGVDDLIKKI